MPIQSHSYELAKKTLDISLFTFFGSNNHLKHIINTQHAIYYAEHIGPKWVINGRIPVISANSSVYGGKAHPCFMTPIYYNKDTNTTHFLIQSLTSKSVPNTIQLYTNQITKESFLSQEIILSNSHLTKITPFKNKELVSILSNNFKSNPQVQKGLTMENIMPVTVWDKLSLLLPIEGDSKIAMLFLCTCDTISHYPGLGSGIKLSALALKSIYCLYQFYWKANPWPLHHFAQSHSY